MSVFLSFSGFFQGKFWGFLHNRVATLVTIGVATLVTIGEQVSPKSDFIKRFFPTPTTQDQTPSDIDYAGLAVVAVFKISSTCVGITRLLATRKTLGIPKLLKCINKAQAELESEPFYKKAQLRSRSHAYENRELESRSHFIFTRVPQPWF